MLFTAVKNNISDAVDCQVIFVRSVKKSIDAINWRNEFGKHML